MAKNTEATDNDRPDNHPKRILRAGVIVAGISMVLVLVAVGVVVGKLLGSDNDDSKGSTAQSLDKGIGFESSSSESSSPSMTPTGFPSQTPSTPPTANPSATPSGVPSENPSASPTDLPTSAPTVAFVPPNPVPDDPPRGYFNYDINDDRYGPDNWDSVDTSQSFAREFDSNGFGAWKGHLAGMNPTENECGSRARHQSPKNLVETIPCDAGHEIRTKCSKFTLSDTRLEKEILPHKLSIVMPRRPCLTDNFEDGDCSNGRPPVADYPRYSSTGTAYSDLHHFDIKVPGEHTLEGVSFHAELQLFHTHLTSDRASSIGIPVQATKDGFNEEFQWILDEFQTVYDRDAFECSRGARNMRRRESASDFLNVSMNAKRDDNEELMTPLDDSANATRRMQRFDKGFDPYSDAFMNTIFFYRYDGSITEPPCLRVTWWVMLQPMIISFEQLNQIKRLLFTHVDSNCQKTSVHNADQSVARPIQRLGDRRDIEKCVPGDFTSDLEKGRGAGKKC